MSGQPSRRAVGFSAEILLLALLLSGIPTHGQPITKHPVALDDLTETAMADSLQLSPDGSMLAYSFGHWSTYLTDNNLWIVETKSGSIARKVAQGTFPHWSPDGKRLAYYSGDAGDYQIWVLDLFSNRSEQITHVKGGINPDPYTRIMGWALDAMALAWSPDGKKLIFASRVEVASPPTSSSAATSSQAAPAPAPDHPAPLVLTLTTPPEWTTAGIYSRAFGSTSGFAHWQKKEDTDASKVAAPPPVLINQLFLVDVDSKQTEQLTTDNAGYFGPAWSPDGTKIVCASADGPVVLEFGSGKTNLYVFDVATHKKTALTNEPEVKWQPTWSSDGRSVAYLSGSFSGHQYLMVIPAGGGKARNLTAELDRYVEEYRWVGDDIDVLIKDGVSHPVVRIELATARAERLTLDNAARDHLSESRDGALAWQQSDGAHAGGIWFRPNKATPARPIVDLNPEVQSWELGKQEVINWKNKRGDEIEGVLITPPGYIQGKKYPLIVDSYPGTSSSFRSSPYGGNQAWASRGYAVLFTSGARGPHVWMNPIKSLKYDLAAKGPHGWDVSFDDVMSGIDEIIRRGIADPDRIGLFGSSNGGAIAQMLITRTDRFKCVVSYAGVPMADLTRSYFATTGWSWRGVVGVAPWDDPGAYVELSSIYRLNKVNLPVLLFDGDQDGDFLLNTIEVYNGLRSLDKDVTFVRYPDQSHVFTGWALKDFLRRTMDFYDAHLKSN